MQKMCYHMVHAYQAGHRAPDSLPMRDHQHCPAGMPVRYGLQRSRVARVRGLHALWVGWRRATDA